VAASYPAQLVCVAALVLYGAGRLTLPGLAVAWVFHLAILIAYLVLTPWHVPRAGHRGRSKANPFQSDGTTQRGARRKRNPFTSR
jgi:hypothetical protein